MKNNLYRNFNGENLNLRDLKTRCILWQHAKFILFQNKLKQNTVNRNTKVTSIILSRSSDIRFSRSKSYSLKQRSRRRSLQAEPLIYNYEPVIYAGNALIYIMIYVCFWS